MQVLFLIVGLIVGALAAFLIANAHNATLKALLNAEKEGRNNDREQSNARLAEERSRFASFREKELAELQSTYQTQLDLFREQVTSLSNKLMRQNSLDLLNANSLQLDQLFRPVKENISQMEKTMAENRESSVRRHASLEKTIALMLEQTAQLGAKADRLSNALQRNNKVAGNWGELILNELLESQGLQRGVHFDVQSVLREQDGSAVANEESSKRMIPDVVLHLADNREVIVDSKVSLAAFVDYQNAESEEQRNDAVRRHLRSVITHVNELSSKKYQDYIRKPKVSAGFVVMFVPIEGALQLALAEQPSLWRDAFDKKVFIVGAQTLIAALRIIDLTWVNVKQERNTLAIMEEARKLVERVQQFYDRFYIVGKKIDEAKSAFESVSDKVEGGKLSILAAGRNLENLGVRGKKALPDADI